MAFVAVSLLLAGAAAAAGETCRFTVDVAPALMEGPREGRLFVVIAAGRTPSRGAPSGAPA